MTINESLKDVTTIPLAPLGGGVVWTSDVLNTIVNPFDMHKDYFEELKPDEKWSEGNKEYPYLKGLRRIAFSNRGGVVSVDSDIIKAPSVNTTGVNKDEAPDCIAAVTVTYKFNDGTSFAGSADASYKAHKPPYSLHLVAIAESKAEARAIRRAFNISQVAKEEMGSSHQEEDTSNEPISDVQIQGIKKIAKRKQLGRKDVLMLIKRENVSDFNELTRAEGIAALKAVNRYKPKPKPAEVPASKE